MSDTELIDIPVRLSKQQVEVISNLAGQCGLTPGQMASAMFVLAFRQMPEINQELHK